MIADLSWVGNVPVDNEAFTRAQITGAKAGSRSRRRLVGIGSKLQDDFEVLDNACDFIRSGWFKRVQF